MWLRGAAAISLLSMVALAQPGGQSPAPAPKPDWDPETRQGALTVWSVVAEGPLRPVSVASLSPELRSQTSGSFGQSAGSFGQSAGSYGQTSGSLGQSAGLTGTSAGNFGVSAGNFGVSTGRLAAAAAAANGSNAIAPKTDSALRRLIRDFDDGQGGLDSLISDFEEVGADELQTRLEAAAGTPDAPDVLVGTPLPQAWSNQNSGLVRQYGLVTLGAVKPIPQTEFGEYRAERLEASILVRAPHPRSAREFIKWLSDRDAYKSPPPFTSDAPSLLATTALGSALLGGEIGAAADRMMAAYDPRIAQQAALAVYGDGLLSGLRIDIDRTFTVANDRFAIVAVRAVMESRMAFGVAHAFVVLRVDEKGRWRVLQLTPNLISRQQMVAADSLSAYGTRVKREEVAQVAKASLAAPVDGDNRSPIPELWWDNAGTGTLEVVEWQMRAGGSWSGSNLFFVPEDAGHLRTRTTGRFANVQGTYRWRVWSLGRGGTSAISVWRSVNILPQ